MGCSSSSSQSVAAKTSGKKIIAVFGATGAQGGGVARAILADGQFSVRALTREAARAAELKDMGAEVVECDANVLDQVKTALAGAHAAFFVTNAFDPTSCATPEVETEQAKNFANAAATVSLKHAIWSTTEDPRIEVPLSSDALPTLTRKSKDGSERQYKIPHFETKADGDAFFANSSVPTTFLLPGFYYDNFFTYFPLKRGEDKTLSVTIPMGETKMAWIAAADIGKVVLGVFKAGPDTTKGKYLGVSSAHLTMDEIATILSSGLGETVVHNKSVTAEIFATFGFPGCEELANMFKYERDVGDAYCGRRSVEETKKYHSELTSFEAFVEANKNKFLPLPA